MRILMLCYEFPPLGGGGSRVVYGLSKEIASLGHEVDLVTMGYRGLPRREEVHGVRVHRVPCVRLRKFACTMPEAMTYLVTAAPAIRGLVARNRYDINHTHFIFPDGVAAWWARRSSRLPYVITAHGSDVPGYNPHRLKLAHRALAPLWKAVTRGAAALVCPSRSIQSLIRARDGTLETTVIPYGFEIGRYAAHRARLNRILVVTRMLRRKGVQHLLLALEGIELPHEVHIVGDGPYLPTLRRMAGRSRARVEFHGWLDNRSEELNRLYETSDIFVLTSDAENFPVALMEAMAAGLAIVTSRDTGCAEVVGESALLVEAGNVAEIRAALLALTSDPERCRRLGGAARRRVEECFGWPVVAEQYLDLYRRHARHDPAG